MTRSSAEARGLLVMIHGPSNMGYAIEHLERLFLEVGQGLTGDSERVWFSYTSTDDGGFPPDLPDGHAIEFEPTTREPARLRWLAAFVRERGIDTVLGFDQRLGLPVHRWLRRGGVELIVDYLGAPASDLNRGLVLLLKRLEVACRRGKPDAFVFETEAMRATGVRGRGLPSRSTHVVPLGVECDRFRPDRSPPGYLSEAFGIPDDRRVFVYSGHMERRKGVHVLLDAFVRVVGEHGRRDAHLLILGDRPGERERFADITVGTPADAFVTFGGYRPDMPEILAGCYAGLIASTGWDSHTRSSVEMAASGLPLVVSRLQGLVEVIEPGVTGEFIEPGRDDQLAERIIDLIDAPEKRAAMGRSARARAVREGSVEAQRAALLSILRSLRPQM